MLTVVDRADVAPPRTTVPDDEDPYIRVKHIFKFRTAHPPPRVDLSAAAVPERHEASSLDDCLQLRSSNVARYGIAGEPRWVNFEEIDIAFDQAWGMGKGKQLRPFTREEAFAPVKLVVADHFNPIRASLVWGPAYAWQCKLAPLAEGQHLWYAYASVAVLNSRYGRAWYTRLTRAAKLRSAKPHGVKIPILRDIPILKKGFEDSVLVRVVGLTHQLMALHEARQECPPLFHEIMSRDASGYLGHAEDQVREVIDTQFSSVERRLEAHITRLLLDNSADEIALLQELEDPGRLGQGSLFNEVDLHLLTRRPEPPPATIFTSHEARWLAMASKGDPESRELLALRTLRFWDQAINSNPPGELVTEPSTGAEAA